jgi:hypothetical protein
MKKKLIPLILSIIVVIILFNSCYFFIFRDYQDFIYPIHKEEPVKGYVKQEGVFSWQFPLYITPWRELVICFEQAYDDQDYQNARTDIYIEICTKKPYNKIKIYEISCNNVILLENKDILIPGMGRVMGNDSKEIEIDGDAFYMLYRVYDYDWTPLVVGSVNTKTFIDRKLGVNQTIFIKQIYSLDDEPVIEEVWEYRVRIGIDRKLELRPSAVPMFLL